MANRITKREHFQNLLSLSEVQSHSELVEFINHEIELLEKKNSSEKKPTAQQKLNESVKEEILDALSETPTTISELIKNTPALVELTNQRVSALMRQLVADGLAIRIEEKRKAFFIKASN